MRSNIELSKRAAAAILAEFHAQRVRELDLDDGERIDADIADTLDAAGTSERPALVAAAAARPAPRTIWTEYRRRAGLID